MPIACCAAIVNDKLLLRYCQQTQKDWIPGWVLEIAEDTGCSRYYVLCGVGESQKRRGIADHQPRSHTHRPRNQNHDSYTSDLGVAAVRQQA